MNLGARSLESRILIAEFGRLDGSAGGEILAIEEEDDLLAAQVRERYVGAVVGGEGEVGGGVAGV